MKEVLNYVYDNLLAIITIIIALIALWQTRKQTKISNKQFLFDRRLNRYLLFQSLLNLYKDNEQLLDYSEHSDDEAIMVDFQFGCLTNISYLESITCVINDPKNNEIRKAFLIKMEDLKKVSNEVKYIFKKNVGRYLSNFIMQYQNVLIELYKYQIIRDIMTNDSIPRKRKASFKVLQADYGELEHRYRLYSAIKNLNDSYITIVDNKVINKIEKIIKL